MNIATISELHKLYLSITVRKFAVSLFGIFVPIYLYNLGYSIQNIAIFYLIYSVGKVTICRYVLLVIARRRTRYAMLTAYVWTAVFILSLLGITAWTGMFYVAPVAMAFMDGFLWSTLHTDVTRLYSSQTGTQQVAEMKIADRLAGLLGPLVGGITATQASIEWVFIVSMLFLSIAAIILWYVRLNDPAHVELSRTITTPKKDMVANFHFNIAASVDEIIWPLYVSLFLVTYQAVGLVTALGFSGAIVATYLAGRKGDKGKNKQTLLAGTLTSSVLNGLRPFAVNPLSISAIALLKDTTGGAVGTAYSAIYYKHTYESEGQINYIYGMELAGGVAMVCLWLVILLATTAFAVQGVLIVAFILAAVANVFVNYIGRDTDTYSPGNQTS